MSAQPPLVLSIFPGIDVLGRGFEAEGFCVVRGGDPMFGQSPVETFHPPAGVFEGVIGGPPCKGDSTLAHLNGKPGETLFHEFQRVLDEARPAWWLMEAVRPHPELNLGNIVKLNNRWLGEEQNRVRYFHTNLDIEPHLETALFLNPHWKHAVLAGHGSREGSVVRGMATYTWEDMRQLQGLPEDYDIPVFKRKEKREVVGNAVPYPVARALAKAIGAALNHQGA